MQISDHEIKKSLAARKIECKSFNSDMLYEPWELLDDVGHPCTTFEDFWQRMSSKAYPPPLPLPAPVSIPPIDPALPSLDIEAVNWFMNKEQSAASDQLRFKVRDRIRGFKFLL